VTIVTHDTVVMLCLLAFVVGALALEASVLVLGGSGRVGGSTVRWLDEFAKAEGAALKLRVGGRSVSNFERMRSRWPSLAQVEFVEVDINDEASLDCAMRECDLVVHTAGPFQGLRRATVLEAAVRRGNLGYVDVCDETELCRGVKELSGEASARNVSALVSCGIWPGASALMAVDAVESLPDDQDVSLDFSFFTAGTGGAGPTIVSATFLLLVTPVLVYAAGRLVEKDAWTEPRVVDFGGDAKRRTVRLLDCPDVLTVGETLIAQRKRLVACESRFATAPEIWNLGFGAAKASLPKTLLADRRAMQGLAVFSEPVVRLVDLLVGSANVMRVDAKTPTTMVTAVHYHEDLEAAVGIATAAFSIELLKHLPSTRLAGVSWPAELQVDVRTAVLRRVLDAPGTLAYDVRRQTTSSSSSSSSSSS
ncbi:hypothetical protein CTAYLR_000876, partial [Chrysophaeum taylorii]